MDRRLALFALAGALPLAAGLGGRAEAQLGGDMRMMALMGGEFSLQSSQLALQRSRNARVRQFAQLESNEQIAYAAAMGSGPGAVPLRQDHAALLEQMSRSSGAAFDRLYLQGQMAGHRELFQINQSMAQGGADPVGRAVATVAVPSIQTHMTMLGAMTRG